MSTLKEDQKTRVSGDYDKASRNSSRNRNNLGSLDEDEEPADTEVLNQNLSAKQNMIQEEEEEEEEEDRGVGSLPRQTCVGFDFLDRMHHLHQLAMEENYKEEEGKRTAMGEFVPIAGKQPLTQLALPTPGPSDYQPKLVISKPAAPQYSIVGKAKKLADQESPGPNKYNTQKDLVWKDRKITLKGKGKMIGVKLERDGDQSVGAAAYNVTHGSFGTRKKSKYTMGLKGRLRSGPPDKLVHPVDTFGFNTPGPAEYTPNSSYWGHGAKTAIGLLLHKNANACPGPAEYDIQRDKTGGPLYSFGARLRSLPVTDDCTPGPGSYKIGTTIGKSVAKSICGRQAIKQNDVSPSPNTYSLPSSIGGGPKNQLTYRAFESAVEASPGPAEYTLRNENLPKGPKFTCRTLCRPGYPDILHHPEHAVSQSPDVGPNTYYPNRCISKNDKPAYSIGTRVKQKIQNAPGPTTYDVKQATRQGHSKAPAFSIGKRIEENPEHLSPGPAAYNPKPSQSTTSYSISGWNRKKQDTRSNLPAANAYAVRSGQTRKGKCTGPAATLKGRPSPFVYSGFSRTINA